MDILQKIKNANLIGRGGGCFPAYLKWEMVKKAEGPSKVRGQVDTKYVVCNVSEGEPGVHKDGYILEHYCERVIDGMQIAMDFLVAEKGIIFLTHKYEKRLKKLIEKNILGAKIEIFIKPVSGGYIGGEETAMLNAIEGEKIEPRLRPPFPTTHGLYGQPTLINNVETFYNVSLVASGEYKQARFYSINGDCVYTGVYQYPEIWTIEKVLKETNNYPKFDFFVQVGGDGSGEVLNSKQLKKSAGGAGSITVYSMLKHKPLDVIKNWINFFYQESCGNCTPCREGTYRLKELIYDSRPDWKKISELLTNLDDTSFCGLGCAVSTPIRSYINNVVSKMPENEIKTMKTEKKFICECFN